MLCVPLSSHTNRGNMRKHARSHRRRYWEGRELSISFLGSTQNSHILPWQDTTSMLVILICTHYIKHNIFYVIFIINYLISCPVYELFVGKGQKTRKGPHFGGFPLYHAGQELLYGLESSAQDKNLKSWQHCLCGLPESQSSIPKPTVSSDKWNSPKFTPALVGSEADIWAPVITRLWREDTCLLTSLDRALWFLLQCWKIHYCGLGRHLFLFDLWILLASGRAISTYCSLWRKEFKYCWVNGLQG